MKRRKLELTVISDVHLGTLGCRAEEVLYYLKSIKPKKLILNGDIIDFWQFKKKYWPGTHTKVLKEVLNLAAKGTEVYYLAGNHDEVLRRFVGYRLGKIKIENKLVLDLNGDKAWFFHGDVFDVTMQHSRWLVKLGGVSYDFLIWMNFRVNRLLEFLGKDKISFSKRIKNGVKGAVKYINKFEETCAEIAIDQGYEYIVCGHIHQPEMRKIITKNGAVTYLNSGDWIENLTSLEYDKGQWSLRKFDVKSEEFKDKSEADLNTKELFNQMLAEFNLERAI